MAIFVVLLSIIITQYSQYYDELLVLVLHHSIGEPTEMFVIGVVGGKE